MISVYINFIPYKIEISKEVNISKNSYSRLGKIKYFYNAFSWTNFNFDEISSNACYELADTILN